MTSPAKFQDRLRTRQVLSNAVKADIVADLGLGIADTPFLQSGTGAVSRGTGAGKLKDVVSVKDFGAVGDNVYDDTAEIQAALDYAGTVGARVHFPAGDYLVTADLLVPVGDKCPDIEGEGWNAASVRFTGAAVTHGFYYLGDDVDFPYCGSIRNLLIYALSGAARCVTYYGVNHPNLTRVQLVSAAGAGVHMNYCLMPKLDHCLIMGCGSASEGQVDVDNSTTFMWDHTRISGAQADAHAGLVINRTLGFNIFGGNIESTSVPIKIANDVEGTLGCKAGTIRGIGLENPGDDNPYIEMGYGWTGSTGQAVTGVTVGNCLAFPSSTATIPKAIKLKHTVGVVFENNTWTQIGSTVATFWLEGATNFGTVTREHRTLYGNPIPYVYLDGSHRTEATPLCEWSQTGPIATQLKKSLVDADGTTPSAIYYPAQGGLCNFISFTHASPLTVTSLSGFSGQHTSLTLQAQNGNTTLSHGAGISLIAGVNLAMVSGRAYPFFWDGAILRQLAA